MSVVNVMVHFMDGSTLFSYSPEPVRQPDSYFGSTSMALQSNGWFVDFKVAFQKELEGKEDYAVRYHNHYAGTEQDKRKARALQINGMYALKDGKKVVVLEKDMLLSKKKIVAYPNKREDCPRSSDNTVFGNLPRLALMIIMSKLDAKGQEALCAVSKEASFLIESALDFQNILCTFTNL